MLFLFCLLLFLVLYTYLLYPLLLIFFKRKKLIETTHNPSLTIIIPAYNEAEIIDLKIVNTLAVSKNFEAQIILVSNGSTDGTENYQHSGITHLTATTRKGKPEAINAALKIATGSVLIFTDANTLLNENAIDHLIKHFSRKQTGAVCGEKSFSQIEAAVSMENLYWKFESWLKEKEAACYSVVGAAGEIFAVRKELVQPIPEDTILDDFYVSMQVCLQGFTVEYAKRATAVEKPSPSLLDEYHRRVRIASGVMQWLVQYGRVNYFKYNFKLQWQFISHRFCRWILVPLALVGIIVLSFMMHSTYPFLLYMVAAYFLLAFFGFIFHLCKLHIALLYYPFYFLFVHFCLLTGYATYFTKKHSVLWYKVKRN